MAKRSLAHTKAQRDGRVRDRETCQICGTHGQAGHMEGHHIVDFSFGGAADSDNIIALCRNCHVKVHKGLIDLLKF